MKMQISTYYKYLIVVIFTLLSNCIYADMALNWAESTTINGSKVTFAADIDFKLPTNDIYEVGFFINDGRGNYICAGKTDIVPNTNFFVYVGGDPTGNIGYKYKQKYITFIRIKNSLTNLYGVEFKYKNDSSFYINNAKNTVTGIKYCTWFNTTPTYPSTFACSNQDSLYINLPYGVIPTKIIVSNNLDLDTINESTYSVKVKNITAGINYTVNISCSWISSPTPFSTYTFSLANAPNFTNTLVNETICSGDSIKLPLVDLSSGLKRKIPINKNYGLTLKNEGAYTYLMTDTITGCYVKQLYNVSKCNTNIKDKIFINVSNNEYVNFETVDKIEIFDISLNKVKTINAPQRWHGDDENGTALPLGMYIVINSKKEVTYVTLVY